MEELNKSYYAIIPANVRYDTRLNPNAKLLYGEITALCNEKGYCWATNEYFAKLYKVSKTSISNWISSLAKYGYISSQIKYKENSKQIESRQIYLTLSNNFEQAIKEKLNRPTEEKLKDNNIIKNNIYNNKNKKEVSTDIFNNNGINISNPDGRNFASYNIIKQSLNDLDPNTCF